MKRRLATCENAHDNECKISPDVEVSRCEHSLVMSSDPYQISASLDNDGVVKRSDNRGFP